jgi:hypothetical protein
MRNLPEDVLSDDHVRCVQQPSSSAMLGKTERSNTPQKANLGFQWLLLGQFQEWHGLPMHPALLPEVLKTHGRGATRIPQMKG